MKIEILTLHHSVNPGAFFQCLALQKLLEKQGSSSVEIINYIDFSHWRKQTLGLFIFAMYPKTIWSNIKKVRNYNEARKRLNLRPRRVTFSQKRVSRISHGLDIIIVGSDIVWADSDAHLGNTDVYFGSQLRPRLGLFSYAASLGSSNADLVVKNRLNQLRKFDAISVREETSAQALTKAGVAAKVVLDPTLLMDASDATTSPPPGNLDNTLVIYATKLTSSQRTGIVKMAKNLGLEIIVIGYQHRWLGRDETSTGPEKWLDFLNRASLVITDTFHGTVFSVMLEKRFITMHRESSEVKVMAFLELVGLKNRYSRHNFDEVLLQENIDWSPVLKKLSFYRKSSEEYIEKIALGSFA